MTDPVKPTLAAILQGLKPKPKVKPEPNPMNVTFINNHKPVPRPHAEWLMDAVPPKTRFEQDMDRALGQREAKPHTSPGPDPRKPWSVPGGYIVEKISEITEGPKSYDEAQARRCRTTPGQPQGTQDRIRLHNAKAKAAQGKRLTRADKAVLGKELQFRARRLGGVDPNSEVAANLAKAIRPKQSD